WQLSTQVYYSFVCPVGAFSNKLVRLFLVGLNHKFLFWLVEIWIVCKMGPRRELASGTKSLKNPASKNDYKLLI
uniref:Ovule protein n=1 Tax=Romanomermis culicivorax TaxID=13658 RepID=A0A915KPT9_ROMCU